MRRAPYLVSCVYESGVVIFQPASSATQPFWGWFMDQSDKPELQTYLPGHGYWWNFTIMPASRPNISSLKPASRQVWWTRGNRRNECSQVWDNLAWAPLVVGITNLVIFRESCTRTIFLGVYDYIRLRTWQHKRNVKVIFIRSCFGSVFRGGETSFAVCK